MSLWGDCIPDPYSEADKASDQFVDSQDGTVVFRQDSTGSVADIVDRSVDSSAETVAGYQVGCRDSAEDTAAVWFAD